MSSTIKTEIVAEIETNNGEINGTEKLAIRINTAKWWTLAVARELENDGQICIVKSNGGRGRMTIYRCPFSKCLHCPRLTCTHRPTRAQLGYPRRARKPR